MDGSAVDGECCSLGRGDVVALLGLCAVVEGYLMSGRDGYADLSRHLGRRFAGGEMAPADADERAVR